MPTLAGERPRGRPPEAAVGSGDDEDPTGLIRDLPTVPALLAARPAKERPSVALQHAIAVPLAACADHSDRALPVVQLILRTPALSARFLERQAQWRDDLSAELADRLDLDADADLYPRMAAGMALNAFDAALQRWSGSDGAEDPTELIDRAFAVIAPALNARRGGKPVRHAAPPG